MREEKNLGLVIPKGGRKRSSRKEEMIGRTGLEEAGSREDPGMGGESAVKEKRGMRVRD